MEAQELSGFWEQSRHLFGNPGKYPRCHLRAHPAWAHLYPSVAQNSPDVVVEFLKESLVEK